MAVMVMLNNYMHDMMTAIFAVSAFAAWFMLRSDAMRKAPEAMLPVARGLVRVGLFSLAWTLLGGMVRGLFYEKYEWMEAVGRAQVPALIVKHVILISLVIVGAIVLYKIRKMASISMGSEVRT
jgi:hypothetical protein